MRSLLRRAFGGSPAKLVVQALSEKKASPDELAEIRELIDRLEAEQDKRSNAVNGVPVALVVESLGWTLLHFVWQGTLVAALLYGLLSLAQWRFGKLRVT